MSDFDRFKLRRAKSIRNKIRTQAFFRLKKKVNNKKKPADKAAKTAKPTKEVKKAAKK